MTFLSKVYNFWCLFSSKMINFRADSNYLANMNMAGDFEFALQSQRRRAGSHSCLVLRHAALLAGEGQQQ